jgi:hypothetical protein
MKTHNHSSLQPAVPPPDELWTADCSSPNFASAPATGAQYQPASAEHHCNQ